MLSNDFYFHAIALPIKAFGDDAILFLMHDRKCILPMPHPADKLAS